MSTTNNKWLFKLERDIDLDMPTAWSGFVRCNGSRAAARRAIASKLSLKRLPANTIVMSQADIEAGKQPRRITNKAIVAKPKRAQDVPMSFDEVQEMLAKLGL